MSDAIKTLQSGLFAGSFYAGKIDGLLGPLTVAAIEARVYQNGGRVPRWMPMARAELGVSEIYGTRHNPRIIEYHATTTLKAQADEVAWCSSFVNFCVEQTGRIGTRSAAARSWLQWSGAESVPADQIQYGDVVIFARGNQSWQGHVAFAVHRTPSHIWHLGGNQSNRVNIQATPVSRLVGARR